MCRFFLESSGPTHEPGGNLMLPFLVDMARLFELFVAEWLQQHIVQDHGHAHLGRCRPDRRLCSRDGSPDWGAHLPAPAVSSISRRGRRDLRARDELPDRRRRTRVAEVYARAMILCLLIPCSTTNSFSRLSKMS
ncbi:MAG: hypothetical protein NT005_03560 [Spirochaetes bacterium]|nr:hypothetical protein [Spirochaetota bacterium]